MALDTYANLQTAITSWAMRPGDSEFVAQVPDFITLAEARLNSRLRVAAMETSAAISLTSGAGTLPTDYLQWRRVVDGSDPPKVLAFASPDYAVEQYPFTTSSSDGILLLDDDGNPVTDDNGFYIFEGFENGPATGTADVFTIIGSTIRTYPASVTGLTLHYYAKIPALSNTTTTNWLLTKSPQLYLYGALVEAAPYMMDDQRAVVWGTLFEKAIKDFEDSDKGARFAHITARVRGFTP